MHPTGGRLVLDAIIALLLLCGVGWCFYRSFKNSEERSALVLRWIFTAGVFLFIIRVVIPVVAQGGYGGAFGGIPLAAVCGIILAILWRRSIAEIMANPLGSIFDGGKQQQEARPLYSSAEKFRQRNQFREAIAEIRQQLEKFPNDFAGQMLLAEINAENLQDLQSAGIIIQKIVEQPGRTPAQISGALHALADWHMKLAQDPESSRATLEKIIERFPDSSFSQMASQRIAHLGSVDSLLANHERPTIALKHFDPYANLEKSAEGILVEAEAEAQNCLKQIEQHPLDTEPREKLAKIYANNYHRLDLAEQELEQLIAQPKQPARQVARWLNLLAELQIKIGNDVPAADHTVRRIPELFPGTAYAEQASLRLEYLRLEAKRNETTEDVKLGVYEKDLGLKKS